MLLTKWSGLSTQLLWMVALVCSLRCAKGFQLETEEEDDEEEEEALLAPRLWLVGSMAPDKGADAAFRYNDGDESVRDSSEPAANGSSTTETGGINWPWFKTGASGLLVRRSAATALAGVARP